MCSLNSLCEYLSHVVSAQRPRQTLQEGEHSLVRCRISLLTLPLCRDGLGALAHEMSLNTFD